MLLCFEVANKKAVDPFEGYFQSLLCQESLA